MPSELRVWRIGRFEGGRNTQSSPYDLRPDESPADLNMDTQVLGSIRRRKGFRKFTDTYFGPDAVTGLYRYYKTNGDKHLMVLSGASLWADPVIIKGDVTTGSKMFFMTMQDWCYFVNFLDRCYRFDGTLVERVGLPSPNVLHLAEGGTGFPDLLNDVVADGRMDQATAKYFTYRFRFRYGKLGTSNLSTYHRTGRLNTFANAMRVRGLQVLANDSGYSLNPANAGTPTHLQIYRSLAHDDADFLTDQEARDKLYYFVDEAKYPDGLVTGTSGLEYIDKKSDLELVALYPQPTVTSAESHTFSEPHLDDWVAASSRAADMAHNEGYGLTPKARYLEEHRNRTFYAGIEETTYNEDGTVDETVSYPSRLYWSDLYQPDRWTGFIDVNPEDGDEITRIFSFHNNLIVFKRTRIYLLLGSQPSDFEVRLVNAYVGLVSSRAVAVLDNRVVFLAAEGIHAFDGANFARISDKIRPDILAMRQDTREHAAAGSYQGRFYIGYEEDS